MLKGAFMFLAAAGRAGRIPAGVAGLVLLPALSFATLRVYEDFNYLPGPLSGAQGGVGWSSPWQVCADGGSRDMTVVEGSLAYGNLQTSGNRVRSARPIVGRTGFSGTDPFQSDFVQRSLTPPALPAPAPAVLWISFLVQIDAANHGRNWFGLKPTGTDDLWVGLNANSSYYGLEKPRTESRTPFSTNSADLIVLRIERRADGKIDKHLWVNPAPDSLGGPDPDLQTATLASLESFGVDSIPGIRAHCADAGDLDEIRIGESFADVTPVAAPVLPTSSLFSEPDAPRWVNGQPAGKLESVEADGLRIRTAQGASLVAPWNLLSPATRFRHQPGFPDRLPGLLKGDPGTESLLNPSTP